eukprot:gnl/MRDRNA2_/MRDRNA2_100646_c0_seq1.p1 gnl/MRDRNA2_/MRDRNA2_100646_c0~~gnl/MRDRNA2_/MRDRNA2_100646_c0_seq1.p1  ORF type:complete len:320 (+),score=72.71 gnl/MRDRNA2_/MRDRNA2_100646_c0_seq1:238-1197(+)
MKILIVLFIMLCVGGSGIHPEYNVVSSEWMDEGLPEIVQEVWRGQGVVKRHLFFLQMYAQQLFGPMPQHFTASLIIILTASLFAAGLSIKASPSGSWWYKDVDGEVQGPFSTLCMKHWRSTGYLPDNLEIKYEANASFVPLRELFPAPAVPFQSPPTPPAARAKAVAEYQQKMEMEQELSTEMLRDQHQAFENRVQGLEEEMIMTLEADLEDSVLSHSMDDEVYNSYFKSYNEEDLAEIRAWRAERQLHRKESAHSQIHMSRYSPDKIQTGRSPQRKQKSRECSEERILKQFNVRCCNEITSEHEAQLEESLLSLIELQ